MYRYDNGDPKDILQHYGVKYRSGRYPYGSGDDPYQHSGDFLSRIETLKKSGLGDTEIAKSMGLSTTQYRAQRSIAKAEEREVQVAAAKSMRSDGLSLNQIAEKMGFKNDSSVRSLLNENSEARMKEARKTADFLKEQIDAKGLIDIGSGVERELGVSAEKMNQAIHILELDGYKVFGRSVSQVTNPGRQTTLKVIGPPDTVHKDIYDLSKINSLIDYTSHDDGVTFNRLAYPSSIDSKRVGIVYAENGGTAKDGLVEIRRGVNDIDLGDSSYAQVRILVDDNKYIKGMAVYGDKFPDGVDMLVYTNKKSDVPKENVFKDITDDPDNPFGALISARGQRYYDDNGEKKLSPINKTREEGEWDEWADRLPSQFLAKQNQSLIKKQLDLAAYESKSELDEILSLTNPAVKKVMLQEFADSADAAAVHLHAAALPRQRYQVILPVNSLKDNEVYAPNYENGETVALVRFPHGGTFEIPILKVNNKNKEAIGMMGKNALDAVGINSKVAERLSGADFDGDFVQVIPTGGRIKITSTPKLAALEGFDPKMDYPYTEGMKLMKNPVTKQDATSVEMGRISNLITDMTLKGATDDELARAVKHSMVVIDSAKHRLNYKKSELDNNIASLRDKYQGYVTEDGRTKGGASTLISRSTSQQSVTRYKGNPNIDPETGRVSYTETFTDSQRPKAVATKYNPKTQQYEARTRQSTQMAETDDAYKLSSGHPKEALYANYANSMKALANQARKEMLATKSIPYDPAAKKTYSKEVASLDAQLQKALLNTPRERQAQVLANAEVKAKKDSNPSMTPKEVKKANQMALDKARATVGAKRTEIELTDREWDAIQAGAISENKLLQITKYVNSDSLRQRATPRATTTLSTSKQNRIDTLHNSGYSNSEIAKALGVSASTIVNYLKGTR